MVKRITWIGDSGKKYNYTIVEPDIELKEVPSNYIYAHQTNIGSWEPIYIGETDNIKNELCPYGYYGYHEKHNCIECYGGSCLMKHNGSQNVHERRLEQMDLIKHWGPPCNK